MKTKARPVKKKMKKPAPKKSARHAKSVAATPAPSTVVAMPSGPASVRIPTKILPALCSWCDGEASRYALGGVMVTRLDDGRWRACATDGRGLVAAYWKDDAADKSLTVIIPSAICKEIGKSPIFLSDLKRDRDITISVEDVAAPNKASIKTSDCVLQFTPVEGRFPKVGDIIEIDLPVPEKPVTLRMDSEKLWRLAAAVSKCLSLDDQFAISVYPANGSEAALHIRGSSNGVEARGVLMPLAQEGK